MTGDRRRCPLRLRPRRPRGPRTAAPSPPAAVRPPGTGRLTSGYGARWGRLHAGIDLAAGIGAPISAVAAGTVTSAGDEGGYGRAVRLLHADGTETLYAHMSELHVQVGQRVTAGTYVGREGSSGHSTGPHLHFEVRIGGVPVDPAPWLRARGVDPRRSSRAHQPRRLGVGREEALDRQLGQRHVGRRAEPRSGGEERQPARRRAQDERQHRSGALRRRSAAGRVRVERDELLVQRHQHRVAEQRRLAPQQRQRVRGVRVDVLEPRRHAVGVQADPQDVDRRHQQRRVDAVEQQREPGVRAHEVPVAVDHQGRVRLGVPEHEVERVADRRHLGCVEVGVAVLGREAGGHQQLVAPAQRHVEVLGDVQDELPARPGAAGLDARQVAGRHLRLVGERELAEPARLAPAPQQLADGAGRGSVRRGGRRRRVGAVMAGP